MGKKKGKTEDNDRRKDEERGEKREEKRKGKEVPLPPMISRREYQREKRRKTSFLFFFCFVRV
jgi:hypothetical protein